MNEFPNDETSYKKIAGDLVILLKTRLSSINDNKYIRKVPNDRIQHRLSLQTLLQEYTVNMIHKYLIYNAKNCDFNNIIKINNANALQSINNAYSHIIPKIISQFDILSGCVIKSDICVISKFIDIFETAYKTKFIPIIEKRKKQKYDASILFVCWQKSINSNENSDLSMLPRDIINIIVDMVKNDF